METSDVQKPAVPLCPHEVGFQSKSVPTDSRVTMSNFRDEVSMVQKTDFMSIVNFDLNNNCTEVV